MTAVRAARRAVRRHVTTYGLAATVGVLVDTVDRAPLRAYTRRHGAVETLRLLVRLVGARPHGSRVVAS